MIEKSPKLLWGVIAFAIYFIVVGLLVFYFNVRSEDKSKHYVKKNENRIQVALSKPKKEKVAKPKPYVKPKVQKKPKPKPKLKRKDIKKKIIKEKIVKKYPKKRDLNSTKPKKIKKRKKKNNVKRKVNKKKKTIDLFSKVKTKKKKIDLKISNKPIKKVSKNNIIKTIDVASASEKISNSLKKQKNKQSGVENAYIAKVESILENWPAQSEFAGEKAMVTFYIKPTGKFEFQVTSGSNNNAFNDALLGFLRQLQGIGFGRHRAGRTYEFEAEFIAKE